MSAFVDISDISIHATRTVRQTSSAQLDDVLDNEQGVEGFFDYYDDWEDDCDVDEFEYEVEVSGVVSDTAHKRVHDEKQAVIDRQKKEIEGLKETLALLSEQKDKLKKQAEDFKYKWQKVVKLKEEEE